MSWYSDGEPFDEFEPDYCKRCHGGTSKAECDRCQAWHNEMDKKGLWDEEECEENEN